MYCGADRTSFEEVVHYLYIFDSGFSHAKGARSLFLGDHLFSGFCAYLADEHALPGNMTWPAMIEIIAGVSQQTPLKVLSAEYWKFVTEQLPALMQLAEQAE